MDKRALRAEARRVRAAVGDRARRSAQICAQVQALPEFARAHCVFAYAATGSEADLFPAIEAALRAGKAVCLPVCREKGQMDAVRLYAREDLAPGAFGILEPRGEVVPPEEIDLVLCPAADITIDIWEKFTHFCSEYAILIASSAPCPRERTTCSWTRSRARRAFYASEVETGMKDIAKFAGTTLLLLLTLTLVSLVFIQSFMGDYEWLNIALTVVYSLAVLAAMVYDGLQRGTQDCKYAALMERQQRERGHEITAAERARMYRPAKGWAAGFLGMAPLLLIAVVAVACGQEPPVLVTLCVRISQGAVLGIFQYVDGLLPWFYLAAPVVFALCVGIGYMAGPKMWARQVRMMEKAKKEKRRRVARRRKKKTA